MHLMKLAEVAPGVPLAKDGAIKIYAMVISSNHLSVF